MAALLTPDLAAWLSEQGRRPWVWGECDCTMWVADWIKAVSGIDPAERYRGRYRTQRGAEHVLKHRGGFVQMVGWRMDDAGFARTAAPGDGDVGIVKAPIARARTMPVVGTVMGIRYRGTWITRSAIGLHFENFELVNGWTVIR